MGARPLIDLKTMVPFSCLIMSWTVGHLSSSIKFTADALEYTKHGFRFDYIQKDYAKTEERIKRQ